MKVKQITHIGDLQFLVGWGGSNANSKDNTVSSVSMF